MIGKTISHYRILDKIGEGGMGVVYKAEDTQLKRMVALKFLPSELTRDAQAKARFVQEAQAAAALDHPNICTIHEINEAEGQTYIAMAYVEGKSLKEELAAGPLAIPDALDIAGQVAEGLKRAHGKGIIHRDIKPGNIMLTDEGQAKIMDFGLAKLTTGPDITKTLTVMGTIAYMSPEQARGESVDHRTDIWSFGAMLYEMLTGQMPFGRKQDEAALDSILPDTPALLHSILYDPVEPPGRLRKDLPRPVEQIILKALDKDRNRRYQGMDEVLKDLKAAKSSEMCLPKPEKSIIVLPFEDISPGKDNEYFSDGLTEEIIADLSHIHDLLVISRSSAMTFKGTKKTIPEIAQAVNVRYVLEGSVRKAGNSLRIAAQLIDSTTDAHLWAEKYSGTLDDVFDIQEKVSRSIVEALKLKLTSEEKKRMVERPIDDIVAYECYLKAYAEIWKCTEDSLDQAVRHLRHGLEIVGDNALIYSGLAYAYWQQVNIGLTQEEGLQKSEECVKRALAIDPGCSKAQAVLGWINQLGGNARKSVDHLKRALAISPDDPFALQGLGAVYVCIVGKIPAAIRLRERLVRIDPLDFVTNFLCAALHLYDGDYGRALEAARLLNENYPENLYGQFGYAVILAYNKKMDHCFRAVDKIREAGPDTILAKLGLLLKYGILGKKENAFELLTPDFRKTCLRDPTYCHHLAGIFSSLDEKKEALDWLENAVSAGFINYPLLKEKDPWLASIRGEPRFLKLMERVKKAWEEFEV